MATLQGLNIPDSLYERLRLRAERHRRSLSAEAAAMLEAGLADVERRDRGQDLLAEIRRLRLSFTPPPDAPESVALLREDHER